VNLVRTAAVVAALALTLAGCVAREQASDAPATDEFTTEEQASTAAEPEEAEETSATEGDCGFTTEGANEEAKVGLPPDDGQATAATMTFTTSAGPIAVTLDANRAPCTVQSMAFLAGEGFFDGTNCHRLTASAGLKVLQCGDPNGDGSGGPGYVVPDEFPTDLPAGPDSGNGPTSIYGRGLVAMANAGPGTTGSQFFLVYGDSTLPPNYTVFGTMDPASLATLDQIAAAGITPGQGGAEDGAPTAPVTIESVAVA
jgi:peptidyl-prolyl cis-trans isomerase B (cyclophilin B)